MWYLIDLAELLGFVISLTKYCKYVVLGITGYERIESLIWFVSLAIIIRIKLNAVNKKENK